MKLNANGDITTIYLKMEDDTVGIEVMSTDPYAQRNNLVPIKIFEKEIKKTKTVPPLLALKDCNFL